MTRIVKLAIVAAVAMCAGTLMLHAQGSDTPGKRAKDSLRAPEGFTWRPLAGMEAAVLVPDGWHLKQEKEGNTEAWFVTREDLQRDSTFSVGLSVNAVTKMRTINAVEAVARYIEKFSASGLRDTVVDVVSPPVKGSACTIDHDGIVIYTIAAANATTNTLYVITFEAPKAQWDAAWKLGAIITSNLRLDAGL